MSSFHVGMWHMVPELTKIIAVQVELGSLHVPSYTKLDQQQLLLLNHPKGDE